MARKSTKQQPQEPKPKTAEDFYADVDLLVAVIRREMEYTVKQYNKERDGFFERLTGGNTFDSALRSYGRDLLAAETKVRLYDEMINLFMESPLAARYSEPARVERAERRAKFKSMGRREQVATLREAHRLSVEEQMRALSIDKSSCWLSSTISQIAAQTAADMLTGYNYLKTLTAELDKADMKVDAAEALILATA